MDYVHAGDVGQLVDKRQEFSFFAALARNKFGSGLGKSWTYMMRYGSRLVEPISDLNSGRDTFWYMLSVATLLLRAYLL